MLKLSPLQRYNSNPEHPFYVPEIEALSLAHGLVVTVNDKPVDDVIGFDVPNGVVKRLATRDDLQRIARDPKGENEYSRVCRDGVRVKGVVRVFVND
jgi:hypothetical protein